MKVIEIFRSLQGESSFAGRPCVFIRLSGCNLRCTYCDTRYAWDGGDETSIQQIIEKASTFHAPIVEVTGGEPLMHADAVPLLHELSKHFQTVLVETNGSIQLEPSPRPYHAIMDIKCPSSGESEKNNLTNLSLLQPGDELKFVICNHNDFKWSEKFIRDHQLESKPVELLFSTCAGELNPAEAADWILQTNLNARLQLQLHKILWPNTDRGV